MKKIPLTQGYEAFVDEVDLERVRAHKWCAAVTKRRPDGSLYVIAMTNVYAGKKKQKTVLLHRFISGAEPGVEVDHIDGNPLNNCRSNLRLCSRSENMRNRLGNRTYKKEKTSSIYKGVSYYKKGSGSNFWMASIKDKDKQVHIGYYNTEKEAALAYDVKAKEIHGDFAKLNFPLGTEVPPVLESNTGTKAARKTLRRKS